MAVGDIVMADFGTQVISTLAPVGPIFGRILLEVAGPPVLADVLWENGVRTNALNRDAVLLKVFQADEDDAAHVGQVAKFMQLTDWPSLGTVPNSTPKSPAAAGVVHRSFGTNGDFAALAPATTWIAMSWYDGRMLAMVASPSSVVDPSVSALSNITREDPGRRVVGVG